MTLTVSSSDGITEYIFCKQRTLAQDKTTLVDTFVAVCTPVQLQDFGQLAPLEPSSYFRDKTITLMCSSMEYLNTIYNIILQDIQKLIIDVTYLTTYASQTVQEITIDPYEIIVPVPTEELPSITVVITGSSPSHTLDLSLTDYYILDLTGATGTLTLTLTNPTVGDNVTIETIQESPPVNITFPINTLQARGGANIYTANSTDSIDLIYLAYDGTNFLITSDQGYT